MPIVELKLADYISKRDHKQALDLYVNLDGDPVPIRRSTGIRIHAKDWDPLRMRVKGRDQGVQKDNLILAGKIQEATEIIRTYMLLNKPLSRKQFIAEYGRKSIRGDFIQFYRDKLQQNYDRGIIGEGSHEAEGRTLRKIESFSPTPALSYTEVNRAWLEKFDAWHAVRLEKAGFDGYREREKALKHIKKYLGGAFKEWDNKNQFIWPFDGFVWPRYKSQPVFLEEQEVRRLMALHEDPDAIHLRMIALAREREMFEWNIEQYASETGVVRIQKIIGWFLFQCFTGVRYSDLERLTFRHIEGDHLVFVPWKTRKSSSVEVRMLITSTLKKYLPQGHGRTRIHKVISNQKYNYYLKEVAQIAEIDKHLTTHVGRHTFATMSLNRGVPVERLKYLMGLTTIKSLMVYVHITQKRLDESMISAYGNF